MKNNTTSECRKTTAARGPRVRRLVRPGGFALLAVLLLGGASGRAESSTNAPAPNAPARPSFDAFRVISDRNIFNPNRFARNSSRVRTETRPTARADAFTLVGLMAYEKGTFAFFDGTKSDYRKTLEDHGAISDFTIASLDPEQVKLVSGTNEFVMRVGMQMRREDEGDWFLTKPGETPRTRVVVSRGRSPAAIALAGAKGAATENGAGTEPEIIIVEPETTEGMEANGNPETAPTTEPANNGNGTTDPVLLRLMQRRQELSR